MWKNILKGSGIIALLIGVLAAVGIVAANNSIKNSFRDQLDDDDFM